MARGITGKAGTVSFAGTAFAAKLRKWHANPKMETVEDTAAGDTAKARLATVQDWDFDCEGLVKAGAYPSYASILGTEVAIAASIAGGTTDFAATGLIVDYDIDVPYNEPATVKIKAQCSSGTAATGF